MPSNVAEQPRRVDGAHWPPTGGAGGRANDGGGAAAAAAPPGGRAAAVGAGARSASSTVHASSIQDLPVYKVRKRFLRMFKKHRVLVCAGATGSGKSTQLPKFLLEAKLLGGGGRMVGITQPRRVAAVTVAKRVAAELASPLGK
jgi:ATP-dependent helicase HrpA